MTMEVCEFHISEISKFDLEALDRVSPGNRGRAQSSYVGRK